MRKRIQMFSKRHHAYIQCWQHKFGFVSAEDELGQIWPSDDGDDDGDDAVLKTATSLTITRMSVIVSITFFYVRYSYCLSSGLYL